MRQDVRKYAYDLDSSLGGIEAQARDLETKGNGAYRSALTNIASEASKARHVVEQLRRAAIASEEGSDSAHERDLDYLQASHPAFDKLLEELEERGRQGGIPVVDRDTGRFLSVMASCMLASEILEIGTAIGFSTLWFARAQPETGRILTIDPDRERTSVALEFFQRAGVADRIEILNQPALSVLPTLPKHRFDIIFIDALKEEYPEYLIHAVPLLKKSGLLLADNLLWGHAASMQPTENDPATTQAIRRFNQAFLHHPQLNATIIPVGDGVGVAAKRD